MEASLRFAAMACEGEIRIAGVDRPEALLQAAADEVRRIEAKYSRYRADSIVSRINAAAGSGVAVEVDDETAGLLGFADSLHQLSDGLFDITSGVLRRAWNFRERRLPTAAAIEALRPLIGWTRVRRTTDDRGRVHLALPVAGMEIDFGGFGKEYAADRAAALLSAAGVQQGLVNLGGDVRLLGPRGDGRGWRLGIQHPRREGATVATLEMRHGALATSGDYERFMDVGGRRYCHILDPRSGWPVQHWQSISVAAPVCTAAGAMTTIAMLKQANAVEFLRAQQAAFVAVDRRGRVLREGL